VAALHTDHPYRSITVKQNFSELGLRAELVSTVAELGYESPTPIQAALIPEMLAGHDVIGQAQTGTGKTAAFALPTLHRLTPGLKAVQALVLVPTRELAVQVASAIFTYGKPLGARALPIYGGQPYGRQVDRLNKGVEVVVGTPGRLLDLIRQGHLDLSAVSTVVLDEADEMLSMGFAEDLEAILAATPVQRQTALLSATLPAGIRRLADQYLNDPRSCSVARSERTADAIEQRYYVVRPTDKVAALTRLLETEQITSALVFAHTRAATNDLGAALSERGFAAEVLNGEMSQGARTEVLHRFRKNRVQILVATDVAARGLDIDHVSHVFNFDVPRDPEVYVHRIGRTGRAGRSGIAIALITPGQRGLLSRIESYLKQTIAPARLPSREDIERLREEQFVEALTAQLSEAPSTREQRVVTALLAAGHDPMEVAAAAVALARSGEAERPIEPVEEVRFGRGPRSLQVREHEGPTREHRREHGRGPYEPGMARLSLNLGRSEGVQPSQVVSAIARHASIPGNVIGKIRIDEGRTLVDVPEEFAGKVLSQSGGYRFGKRLARIERT
jgi:ATP-dependent RNA helicase DeaD